MVIDMLGHVLNIIQLLNIDKLYKFYFIYRDTMILKITWKMQTIFKKRKLIKKSYSSLKGIFENVNGLLHLHALYLCLDFKMAMVSVMPKFICL